MVWDGRTDRRKAYKIVNNEHRGALRSNLGGISPPMPCEALPDEEVPPRLLHSDLENPHKFRERLVAWLMKQH